jgi:NAD(P)-dependent dehydrogenase (short-subunit alcohol dehydrogenase family)
VRGKLLPYLSVVQPAVQYLRANGSVTLIGADSAEAALPGTAGLAAVNGGLHATVRPLAVELVPLRVNMVAPGVIQTQWWDGMPEPVRAGVFASAAACPAGRTGTPDDVAAAVALLIGSGYIAGPFRNGAPAQGSNSSGSNRPWEPFRGQWLPLSAVRCRMILT